MQLRTGVDLIEIGRIRQAVARHGVRFLERVFTPLELAQANGRSESLAGKFAAKEAVAKALGTGIWRNGICWTDIEIHKNMTTGAPTLVLVNAAQDRAAELGLHTWSISISHDRTLAIAMVVAV